MQIFICRPTMILNRIDNIRDLFGHKVQHLTTLKNNAAPSCLQIVSVSTDTNVLWPILKVLVWAAVASSLYHALAVK